MSYKRLKLKLRVFLAGHIVAMVTYCATKLTATCSPMIEQFVDTMILASTGIELVIMTHQTLSLEKYWKLLPATLRDLDHVQNYKGCGYNKRSPDIDLSSFVITFLRPVYTSDFCRAKIASSFKHVQNPCDIAATNRTETRTWFTRAIWKLQL